MAVNETRHRAQVELPVVSSDPSHSGGTAGTRCGGAQAAAPDEESDEVSATVALAPERCQVTNATGPLRTSSYTIYVDLPDDAEHMLLVHGYTGAFSKVSRALATYLRALEVAKAPKPLYGVWQPEPSVDGRLVEPSEDAVNHLRKRGFLTTTTIEAEEQLFSELAITLHERATALPTYILLPTYDCNLRCFYCFQDHMRRDPAYRPILRRMTTTMVDRVFAGIAFIDHQSPANLESVATGSRRLGLFGGEPLLRENREIVTYIIQRGRDQDFTDFWAISNATDLNVYEDLLAPPGQGGLSQVQITLDGPPDEHDKRRIYADGTGSFERIADNIDLALDRGVAVQVRLNVDKDNILSLVELGSIFEHRGWVGRSNFTAYTAPIRGGKGASGRARTFTSWELDHALDKLRQEYPEIDSIARPDDALRERALGIFQTKQRPQLHSAFCSAHTGMHLFDALGDIYACWERMGDVRLRIGHVLEDGTVEYEGRMNQMWRSRNVTSNDVCRRCRYALNCGGGCAVMAEGSRGRIDANFCDGYGSRFRSMVAEAYVQFVAGQSKEVVVSSPCDL